MVDLPFVINAQYYCAFHAMSWEHELHPVTSECLLTYMKEAVESERAAREEREKVLLNLLEEKEREQPRQETELLKIMDDLTADNAIIFNYTHDKVRQLLKRR